MIIKFLKNQAFDSQKIMQKIFLKFFAINLNEDYILINILFLQNLNPTCG